MDVMLIKIICATLACLVSLFVYTKNIQKEFNK